MISTEENLIYNSTLSNANLIPDHLPDFPFFFHNLLLKLCHANLEEGSYNRKNNGKYKTTIEEREE